MKSYLVEFDNLVTNDPVIEVFHGETEEEVYKACYEYSKRTGLSQGNFEMYPIYRDPSITVCIWGCG